MLDSGNHKLTQTIPNPTPTPTHPKKTQHVAIPEIFQNEGFLGKSFLIPSGWFFPLPPAAPRFIGGTTEHWQVLEKQLIGRTTAGARRTDSARHAELLVIPRWKKTSYEALGMYLESTYIGNILCEMSVSLKGHVGWIIVWWLCDLFCLMVPNLILFQLGGWSTVRLTVCWRFRSYSVLRLWEKISLRRLERCVKRWSSQAWSFMPWVMLWLLWEDTDWILLV